MHTISLGTIVAQKIKESPETSTAQRERAHVRVRLRVDDDVQGQGHGRDLPHNINDHTTGQNQDQDPGLEKGLDLAQGQ